MKKTNSITSTLIALFIGFVPVPAIAHDFWIEPSTFSPVLNRPVALTLRVGENFMGDAVPRMPSHVRSFTAQQANGTIRVSGTPNSSPAGQASFVRQGSAIIVYDSNATVAELDRAKFAQYVREEGLERQVARAALGGTAKIRDAFSRHAKALLAVGGSKVEDRRTGMPFEIVAISDIAAAARAKKLPVRLYFRNQPVKDVLVVAIHKRNPARRIAARTSDRGEVTLPLDQPGLWLIKAVHLVPASDKRVADIESYWASLTFELPR